MVIRRFAQVVAVAVVCVVAASAAGPVGVSGARNVAAVACTILPSNNVWHSPVTSLPLNRRSATYVRSIGASSHLHPDFGSGLIDGAPFGMPITIVRHPAAAVRITFEYASESNHGPYRIPATALVEGGSRSTGDRHVIVLDTSTCTAYELYDAHRHSDGSWTAGSGAIYNLRSNALRPAGWTSADAAGLPIVAGLVRYSEVANGRIDHAIRMTVPRTDLAYLWPARHYAAYGHNAALPPMGLRLRLKKSVSLAGLPPQARIIAQALKTYGAIVADNGSAWYITGTQDSRWSNSQLNTLKRFTGANFEAVSESGLQISANSGQARR